MRNIIAFTVSNKILSRFIALMVMPKGKNRLNKLKIFSVIELHMMLYEEEINGVEFPACSSDSKHKYLKTKEGESRCL
ncbi:hypothetical protein CMK14_10590 [Candidatus Poribacteria bacterium]|nr:hypothetical protein [Candidatus Poribacteria bacterium]|tara:strand:- start:22 stop:255 length:234 start_codon:yes stop_codon:yes gene_type:complete